jgi:myo-inositol-1(or 4)-monophosphatase
MGIEQIQRVGIAAARNGAQAILDHLGRLTHIDKKGAIDLVTAADLASEAAVIQTIRQTFADHGILAEESGIRHGETGCQWIIDPLDGTTNFAHGLGLFAVSIAFVLDGALTVGIVLNPVTGELFTATARQGATLNGVPISVSDTGLLQDSLLVTGFPYDFKHHLAPMITRFTRCLSASQGVRRLGSAALDLCYVACGRFEGFWEQHLKPWDTAAGCLIAREAGAVVTDFSGLAYQVDKTQLLATNGKIHAQMLSLLDLKDLE